MSQKVDYPPYNIQSIDRFHQRADEKADAGHSKRLQQWQSTLRQRF